MKLLLQYAFFASFSSFLTDLPPDLVKLLASSFHNIFGLYNGIHPYIPREDKSQTPLEQCQGISQERSPPSAYRWRPQWNPSSVYNFDVAHDRRLSPVSPITFAYS